MKTMILGILGALLVGGFAGSMITTPSTTPPIAPEETIVSETPDPSDYLSMRPQIESLDTQELTEKEMEGLVFMREEEKLARDVYLSLYDAWNLRLFSNISQSEQTHTEAVRTLLVKYDINDPVADDTIGVFQNEELAQLYESLVTRGEASVEEALQVGALIEDLDIKDLQEYAAQTDNADIQLVYANLERGSRNHLRAFVSQIEARGGVYVPEYITEEEFAQIVSSERETGVGGKQHGQGGRGWGNR